MNSKTLNKITIIIPTFNRPLFLLRLLKFYESYGFPMKMLILDSSNDVFNQDELQDLLTNKKISYQKFNSDIYISQPQKIAEALKNISTPYSVVCADDDFIVPSAVAGCVAFLEKNPDYSVVLGVYCSHSLKKRKSGKIEFNWAPAYYQGKSITFDSPFERLKFHLSNYLTPTFYGVHRTSTLRFIHKETLKTTSHGKLSEILLTALTLIYGKMKILPIFYSSRERGVSSVRRSYNFQHHFYLSWSSFLAHPKFNAEYKRAIDCLAKNLQKQTNLNIDESRGIAKDALDGYLDPLRQRFLVQKKRNKIRKPIKFFFNKFHLLNAYKQINAVRSNVCLRSMKKEYLALLEKNDPKFYENFNQIKKAIIKSQIYTI